MKKIKISILFILVSLLIQSTESAFGGASQSNLRLNSNERVRNQINTEENIIATLRRVEESTQEIDSSIQHFLESGLPNAPDSLVDDLLQYVHDLRSLHDSIPTADSQVRNMNRIRSELTMTMRIVPSRVHIANSARRSRLLSDLTYYDELRSIRNHHRENLDGQGINNNIRFAIQLATQLDRTENHSLSQQLILHFGEQQFLDLQRIQTPQNQELDRQFYFLIAPREGEDCPVCMITSSNIGLKCNHRFCYPCLKKWYFSSDRANHKCCPICRKKIEPIFQGEMPKNENP